MLAGVLLAAAGIIALLLTGFDPVYGSLGLAVAVAGGGLAWTLRRGDPEQAQVSGPQRARQAPANEEKPPRASPPRRM